MATLSRELRKELERVVIKARRVAEDGARKALESLAVHHHEPWGTMTVDQRNLRNRLRAHGRQLGDELDQKRGTQSIAHLISEAAYEQWHRMLFARFLAKSDLLIEPDSNISITFDECIELARERGCDWLGLASDFAIRMLPQIFRAGDPVLEISFPPESRQELEGLLKSLPRDVFIADDSLGWVYQFWQTERKEQVNKSEVKIGADELPAVTQLFTEDYMVLFLLHNTLGAWWTAKRKAEGKSSELPGYQWTYLRLKEDGMPAAGTFDGWPLSAKDLKMLDPCMGSGHFLVFALPILVAFRMEEEGLSREQATQAVLRDNLFGLEIDPRCTQIAAFNLALSAWRMVGYRQLSQLNLACSGLGINAKEEDWLKLAGTDDRLRGAMKRLYDLFQQAPILGSLIDPRSIGGDLFIAEFAQVHSILESALAVEQSKEESIELAVTGKGIVEAGRILATEFTLVITNVPYLGRGRQAADLASYLEEKYSNAKMDLATSFIERCMVFCRGGGSVGLVTPQYWLFLKTYKHFRRNVLATTRWKFLARLGPRAFEMVSGEIVNIALFISSRGLPISNHRCVFLDASAEKGPLEKAAALAKNKMATISQVAQLRNPDSRVIASEREETAKTLNDYAIVLQGVSTTDMSRFIRNFWEKGIIDNNWEWFQMAPNGNEISGLCGILFWQQGRGELAQIGTAHKGIQAVGQRGVAVAVTNQLYTSWFLESRFDGTLAVVIPREQQNLLPIAACFFSEKFRSLVREVDQALSVTESSFARIHFDLAEWQKEATRMYGSHGPVINSPNPSQWLFGGHPKDSNKPLLVAVSRLLGYRWPRQTGSSFPECPPVNPDGLESHEDNDGIVCLSALKGEPPAADRLRALLADAFGQEWSSGKQAELLAQAGFAGKTLEEWLRDGFFDRHCELFHQRPFIWHIWDGLKNGFHALVNYHKLAAPKGEGRRTLEKLIFTYLGDWIDRQSAEQKAGVEGADARLAAAQHLKKQLEEILEGELPYDLFVRWKPVHEQPIGWEPDINDGVRINIRPFLTAKPLNARGKNICILRSRPNIKWNKDRGKEPHRPKEESPWFWSWDEKTEDFTGGNKFDGNRWNDLHYSRAFKLAARERRSKSPQEQD